MGLFAFNRMRLKRVEEMRPENINKVKEEEAPVIVEEVPVGEAPKENKRGSKRK